MPDSHRLVKLQLLQRQRDELRSRLRTVEDEIESIQAQDRDLASSEANRQLIEDIEHYLPLKVIGVGDDKVQLRARSGNKEADLLCVLLATRVERDGSWWTGITRLQGHLVHVKQVADKRYTGGAR